MGSGDANTYARWMMESSPGDELRYHRLCPDCAKLVKRGKPALTKCNNTALIVKFERRRPEFGGLTNLDENVVMVCCGVASQVRDITNTEEFFAAVKVALKNLQ